jgi:hypothetical protein
MASLFLSLFCVLFSRKCERHFTFFSLDFDSSDKASFWDTVLHLLLLFFQFFFFLILSMLLLLLLLLSLLRMSFLVASRLMEAFVWSTRAPSIPSIRSCSCSCDCDIEFHFVASKGAILMKPVTMMTTTRSDTNYMTNP